MAKTNTLKRVQAASNPYMGMSVADMKRKYDTEIRGKKLSAKQLSVIANQMQAAKKAGLKSKPKASKPAPNTTSSTPKTKPAATTKSQASDEAVEGGYTISKKNRQPKSSTRHRGGRRARVSPSAAKRRERLKAGARRVSEAARRQNPNPSSMAMGPAKNPQKGHTYKKPFGRVMVFNGTKYVPK